MTSLIRDAAPCTGVMLALLLAAPAHAAIHCVDTPTQLQSALTSAGMSTDDDEIRLRSGHYLITTTLEYNGLNAGALRLSGGWIDVDGQACAAQLPDARASRLDGANARRILRMTSHAQAPSTIGPHFSVSNLQFDNGLGPSFGYAGGLQLMTLSSLPVRFDLDNVVMSNNRAMYAGALDIRVDSGSVRIVNSLFYDNATTEMDFGHVHAALGANVQLLIANSTFARGECGVSVFGPPRGCGVGAILSGSTRVDVVNSVFWDNATNDIYLEKATNPGAGSAHIAYSLASIAGDITPTVASALSGDPLFADPGVGDYRLLDSSPFINAGDPAPLPPPGQFGHDIHGNPRVAYGRIDPGALENQTADTIFANGFQSPGQ